MSLFKRIKNRFGKQNAPAIYESLYSFLTQLGDKEYYYILGYGSLLNSNSTKVTMSDAEDCGFVKLQGYERVFDMGWGTDAFLNIRKNKDSSIVVRKWKLNKEDFVSYLIREGLYEFRYNKEHDAVYCINIKYYYKSNILPSLNYIRTCVAELDEDKLDNFWNTTYNRNGEKTIDYIRRIF